MLFNSSKTTMRDIFFVWRKKEGGFAETATAIFIIPFLMSIVFILVEAGYNLQHRSSVEMIVQDVTRGVAQDGAISWRPTATFDWATYQAGDGAGRAGWERWGTEKVQALCGDSDRRCRDRAASEVRCSVGGAAAGTNGLPGKGPAPRAGAPVECQAVFTYRNLVPFMNNPVFSMGFNTLWSNDIVISSTSRTVVGDGR